jgi:tripartite-type tricarboxylate transporter receptor subunit TctC
VPEVRSKLLEAGAEVNPISSDEFAAFAKAESAKFLRIIKDANLKPE